ncbi:MAG: hypothetical protein H3C30_01555 [Candidatus Hydrogenedentes bacterium]|nr:hypothetical protein [Candidatus Hydrogenedentota bacterium]
MKRTSARWTPPWRTATLALLLLSLTACATTPRPRVGPAPTPVPAPAPASETVRVIPADRTLRALPNGNYEVTPAWLQEQYRLMRWQAEEIRKLRGGDK